MKICIVYDTKREKGATVQIVQWMLEELKKMSISADAKRVSEVDSFNYDVFIVGSPIYYEKTHEERCKLFTEKSRQIIFKENSSVHRLPRSWFRKIS